MNKRSSFQRLLAHAVVMVNNGQKYQRVTAVAEARMQYNGAIALLDLLADEKSVDSPRVDALLEHVHGLLARICCNGREFEPAVAHWEEQLALHAKLYGANAIGLVDISVSLCKNYLEHLNKPSEARAVAGKACEIVTENGSQAGASAIYVYYYLCLCERGAGNKAAAAVALNRALAMLDANPSIISRVEAHVIRSLASEFA